MNKYCRLSVCFFVLFISGNITAQLVDDTSKVIIKRVTKSNPEGYNISDIYLKKDKKLNIYEIRVDLDVPLSTKLSLAVKDTSEDVLMYLINDIVIPKGTYRVRWEMPLCKETKDCDGYLAGRYLCVFETDQFIYQKDFFLK